MNQKLKYFHILFFSFFFYSSFGQNVQWSSELIKFSTEYSRKEASAKQVLGEPDKLPAWGQSNVAWAPQTNDHEQGEFIQVGFQIPMQITQVAIGESYNPGTIREIQLISIQGKKISVYKNDTITPRFSTGGKLFHVYFPLTEYQVKEVKVFLNTKAIPGMNQIDCIGISDSDIPIEVKINEIVFNQFEGNKENLGAFINCSYDDMLPIISPDGNTIYLGRKKHPENIGEERRDDIWYSTKNEKGNWTAAMHMQEPLNNEHHNFVVWVSPEGNTLALANDYKKPGQNSQTVSISTLNGNAWSFPKALPINDMYSSNEFSCYTLNTESNILLMAIERPETLGDMDIYVSFKQKNNAWTKPKNIGPTINTAATEGSVFIAADNRTIYFSTNGMSGYGGFDMYMSKRLDDSWMQWSEPVNLGKKINTKQDDFYYTIPASGDYAYFSSRENSMGGADIFRIKLPKEIQPDPVTLLQGKIIDHDTKKIIEADIEFGALLEERPQGLLTTIDGEFTVVIPQKEYSITIKKQGYFPVMPDMQEESVYFETDYLESDSIKLPSTELKDTAASEIINNETYSEKEVEIEIEPLKEGQIIELNNVFFDANKSTLKSVSQIQLDEIVLFLKENSGIFVEIGGHTNGLPEDDFCQTLSDARAKEVAEYFISKGINASRVTWKGYGKKNPVADNGTVEGRKKNQRVELKIIKIIN